MSCLKDIEFIDIMEGGEVPEAALKHLETCGECRRTFNELKDMSKSVELLKFDEIPEFSRIVDRLPIEAEEQRIDLLISMVKKLSEQVSSAKDVLTKDDVMNMLRLNPQEFESVSGDIPSISVCGKLCYLRTSVLKWLSSLEQKQNKSKTFHNTVHFERLLRESY